MSTWLLTWNPSKWKWNDKFDGYEELKSHIRQVGIAYMTWSCGVNKSIKKGDRLFLIRLSDQHRGIIASGYAASDVIEGPHWDEEKDKAGIKARRVYMEIDRIVDDFATTPLSMDRLIEIGPGYRWNPQSSGVSIPEEISEQLESIWMTE